MDFDLILKGLFIVSVLTTATVQVLKQLVNEKKPTLTALVVSAVLSIATSVIYIVYNNVAITPQIICTIVVFIFLSFLMSTLGFDKIKEIVLQIKEGKTVE